MNLRNPLGVNLISSEEALANSSLINPSHRSLYTHSNEDQEIAKIVEVKIARDLIPIEYKLFQVRPCLSLQFLCYLWRITNQNIYFGWM